MVGQIGARHALEELDLDSLVVPSTVDADRELPRLPRAGRLGRRELGDGHVVRLDRDCPGSGCGSPIESGERQGDRVVSVGRVAVSRAAAGGGPAVAEVPGPCADHLSRIVSHVIELDGVEDRRIHREVRNVGRRHRRHLQIQRQDRATIGGVSHLDVVGGPGLCAERIGTTERSAVHEAQAAHSGARSLVDAQDGVVVVAAHRVGFQRDVRRGCDLVPDGPWRVATGIVRLAGLNSGRGDVDGIAER